MKMSGVPNKNVVAPEVPGVYVIVCDPERLMLCGARLPELNEGDQSLQSSSGALCSGAVDTNAMHMEIRNFIGMSGDLISWFCKDAMIGGQGLVGSPLGRVADTPRR